MEKKKNSRLNWNKLRNYVKSTPVDILSKKFNYQNYPLYSKYKNSYSRYFKKESKFQKIREQDYENQNAQKNQFEQNLNKSSRNYSQVTYRNHVKQISEELYRGSNINS
ncbi:hypothetical protein PPERSA_04020 [Pseudocohnilembus persalinus]|uniref:Uncharacterized protein n=1 Tax=Pseudocohnilembus persalinus TaxID=266149 RepID=A0A0V0QL87_PSEPJ|nr:hypothetical protein PPERSA_04020 [Pseudocohnilembus persalinus]|eukprot:KRX02817.1 hypothetical protein PPERSA_04020 [Pseudocohnilembus persalinus]